MLEKFLKQYFPNFYYGEYMVDRHPMFQYCKHCKVTWRKNELIQGLCSECAQKKYLNIDTRKEKYFLLVGPVITVLVLILLLN